MPPAESTGLQIEPDVGTEVTGEIVKGVSHVDPDLAWDLAVKPFDRVKYDTYTVRMLNEIRWRDRSYDNWGIGQDYGNLSYSTARLQVDDLKIRTVFTVQKSLRLMLRQFLGSLAFWFLFVVYLAMRPVFFLAGADPAQGVGVLLVGIGVLLLVAAITTLVVNARAAHRIGKALLVEQHPDAILLDVGSAVFMALRDAELVSSSLRPE